MIFDLAPVLRGVRRVANKLNLCAIDIFLSIFHTHTHTTMGKSMGGNHQNLILLIPTSHERPRPTVLSIKTLNKFILDMHLKTPSYMPLRKVHKC